MCITLAYFYLIYNSHKCIPSKYSQLKRVTTSSQQVTHYSVCAKVLHRKANFPKLQELTVFLTSCILSIFSVDFQSGTLHVRQSLNRTFPITRSLLD